MRGLLFWTIWCLRFWFRTKIEQLTQFQKKLPPPPIFRYIQVFHIWDFFFLEIASIAQFLSEIKNKASNCSEEQSPSIQIPKKLASTTLGGGGSPSIYVSFVFHQVKMDTFLLVFVDHQTKIDTFTWHSYGVCLTHVQFRYPQAPHPHPPPPPLARSSLPRVYSRQPVSTTEPQLPDSNFAVRFTK